MKKYTGYGEMHEALKQRESFTGNSASAVRVDDSGYGTDGGEHSWYSIYSYSTLILRYNLKTHRVEYYDPQKYSRTTGKLQAIIRDVFRTEIEQYLKELRENLLGQ